MIRPGMYRHFRGNLYNVIAVARHTETEEDLVIYQDVSNPDLVWARPECMFLETVNKDDYTGPRFIRVE